MYIEITNCTRVQGSGGPDDDGDGWGGSEAAME